MLQFVSLVGAFLILAPFAAVQWKWLRPEQASYLLMNFAGSTTLGVVAVIENQWGFILLEIVWAGVSLWGLWKLWRGGPPAPAAPA